MARKPRIHIPGGFYHVILRGNGGQDIYFDAEDRNHFYILLQQGIVRYGHRIHGFCCMPNHVHLIIQVAEESLSVIIQNLSFRYTRWINKRQKRLGHLFQGRYKAILVDSDNYLLELVRYVHLNPVRARLVRKIEKYPWSSHSAYLGLEILPWLTRDEIYGYFGRQRAACIRKYSAFVIEGLGESYRDEFHGSSNDSRILGESDFIEKTLTKINEKPALTFSLTKISKVVCKACEIKEEQLGELGKQRKASEARAIVAWLSKKYGCETLTSVAAKYNRKLSAISYAATKIDDKRREDIEFSHRLTNIEKALFKA